FRAKATTKPTEAHLRHPRIVSSIPADASAGKADAQAGVAAIACLTEGRQSRPEIGRSVQARFIRPKCVDCNPVGCLCSPLSLPNLLLSFLQSHLRAATLSNLSLPHRANRLANRP